MFNARGDGSLQGPAASFLAPHHLPGNVQRSHPTSMGPGACHRGAGHSFQETPEIMVQKSLWAGQEKCADRGTSDCGTGGQDSAAETRGRPPEAKPPPSLGRPPCEIFLKETLKNTLQ